MYETLTHYKTQHQPTTPQQQQSNSLVWQSLPPNPAAAAAMSPSGKRQSKMLQSPTWKCKTIPKLRDPALDHGDRSRNLVHIFAHLCTWAISNFKHFLHRTPVAAAPNVRGPRRRPGPSPAAASAPAQTQTPASGRGRPRSPFGRSTAADPAGSPPTAAASAPPTSSATATTTAGVLQRQLRLNSE